MDSIGQAKPNAEQEEVVKPGRLHQLPLPAELESLESHDLEKLEKDIITQLPSNLVITKVKPSVYIGVVTAAWGIVSMCQAFTHNFAGLFVSSLYLVW
ncbi:hypothetical protein PENSUB_4951 [Penicillium subrubescens]|uniref:Uncharacterized protein n=1 Tax=Penicillium subrubescens TaxID=1316194 RepID=A0A1Q5UB36_9EURO|nr:hypothetical protein PENSUB_4951 [Penicillium subrubescens]